MKLAKKLLLVLKSGGAAAYDYAQVLIDTYAASEVWPLVDIASGTTILAKANANRNGTLVGWDLQNIAGPVANTLAPYSDGSADAGNILTSNGVDGLVDIFNGAEGSVFGFLKYEAATWADGTFDTALRISADTNNYIAIRKQSTNNQFSFFYSAGGIVETINNIMSPTDWFSYGLSWSKSADSVRAFINGAQVSATNAIGTWAGAISVALIGSNAAVPDFVLKGWTAFVAARFGAVWSPTDFANIHAAATNPT